MPEKDEVIGWGQMTRVKFRDGNFYTADELDELKTSIDYLVRTARNRQGVEEIDLCEFKLLKSFGFKESKECVNVERHGNDLCFYNYNTHEKLILLIEPLVEGWYWAVHESKNLKLGGGFSNGHTDLLELAITRAIFYAGKAEDILLKEEPDYLKKYEDLDDY